MFLFVFMLIKCLLLPIPGNEDLILGHHFPIKKNECSELETIS